MALENHFQLDSGIDGGHKIPTSENGRLTGGRVSFSPGGGYTVGLGSTGVVSSKRAEAAVADAIGFPRDWVGKWATAARGTWPPVVEAVSLFEAA